MTTGQTLPSVLCSAPPTLPRTGNEVVVVAAAEAHARSGPYSGSSWKRIATRLSSSSGEEIWGRRSSFSPNGIDAERLKRKVNRGTAIVDAAKDADLIIVGSRGPNPVQRILLGSVSSKVVHRAPVRCAGRSLAREAFVIVARARARGAGAPRRAREPGSAGRKRPRPRAALGGGARRPALAEGLDEVQRSRSPDARSSLRQDADSAGVLDLEPRRRALERDADDERLVEGRSVVAQAVATSSSRSSAARCRAAAARRVRAGSRRRCTGRQRAHARRAGVLPRPSQADLARSRTRGRAPARGSRRSAGRARRLDSSAPTSDRTAPRARR